MDEDVLSIGPFSAACGLSVRTLRHYDEIGLLRPDRVDDSTGYRYYGLSQLADARAIRRLRDLDLPLDAVREVLGADEERVRVLLRSHRERMATAVVDAGWICTELDMLIDGREALVPPTEIEIDLQEIPELRLAAVMRHLHDHEVDAEVPAMLDAVQPWLAARGAEPTEPPVAIFRSGDGPGWHIVEAGWPAPSSVESEGPVGIRVYPASRAAVHEHHGPYSDLRSASPLFIAAVAERGLQPSQAIRVVYLRDMREHPAETLRARIVWPVLS